ncbi:hypothetical protein BKA62DRAFT_139030 [Auriculariales sp. MPI-PUGE-AT-0066]|nr:hypothetical protein BKA62DRAFT_139030 [Auriculariales sp. MPI-PUGE-AT-0066]
MERVTNSSIFNSTIFNSFLSFSANILRNVKNIDLNFSRDLETAAAHAAAAASSPRTVMQATPTPTPSSSSRGAQASLPGPVAFATSYYFVGVLVVSFLLNRIQNVAVAPGGRLRRPERPGFRAFQVDPRVVGDVDEPEVATWHEFISDHIRRVYDACLPLDPASSLTRLTINFPALYLLLKALLLHICLILQVSDLFPTSSIFDSLRSWSTEADMAWVCWQSFVAVSVGLVCGALCHGLMNDPQNEAIPFNMTGYAFLLHIYAAPVAHSDASGDNLPSRPNRDVLITMFLPILQLTLLLLMSLRKQSASQRLLPTMFCGICSLVHFYTVIWQSPLSYPPLNFVPCILTSALIFVTLITCGLSAMTQILTEGRISKPLLGHRQVMPRLEDDWEIALLRLGTAALQATQATGLGNEVASLNAGQISLSADRVGNMQTPQRRHGFTNEITRVVPESRAQTTDRRVVSGKSRTSQSRCGQPSVLYHSQLFGSLGI